MNRIRAVWRNMFDIREGEATRVWLMALYLTLVLFAYYIIKPVSRAMFLSKFDIDSLPWLYVIIAGFGGIFAFLFTKLAIHTSLKTAVTTSMALAIVALVTIWYLLGFNLNWMLYVFNVFVSLFSITLVSQGWLVAANVFTTREAKRLYGLLGLGMVVGAAFGGSFTALLVQYTGPRNLLLASALMVLLAYFAFAAVVRTSADRLKAARGAEEDEQGFSAKELAVALGRYRHLQVIITIILMTYIVDVMVEYQFNAAAKIYFKDNAKALTAFLGSFYGIWLNLLTFFFQFFLTAFIVSTFGVGGALQIMPFAIGATSVATFALPSVYSAGAMRLSESATRYTFNKTGMELLYLPLPTDLKNRTKAFVDIFVDRFSRGVGGLILVLLTTTFQFDRYIPLVVLGLCVIWSLLSLRAKREYVSTVRQRLEMRRLDLDDLRVNVRDANTIKLLEQTIDSGSPRQIAYALSLLSEAPGYEIEPLLEKLAAHKESAVRADVYRVAMARKYPKLRDAAMAELRSGRKDAEDATAAAVNYGIALADDPADYAKRLLDHPNTQVAEAALEGLSGNKDALNAIVNADWIKQAASATNSRQRALAATAIRLRGDENIAELHKLILDDDKQVATAAIRAAGTLQNRRYLDVLLQRLSSPALRGEAIDALAAFGERVVGTLGDVLLDPNTPSAVRRQIPRVLARVPHQRSVDLLMASLEENDLTVRSSILRALNKLREAKPDLAYGKDPVMQLILREARSYYELNAALAAFRDRENGSAAKLLARTIEERLKDSLERLFRLLGLRYPPREIYAAYLALHNRRSQEQSTAALEFLDNVLDRDVKRVVLPLLDDEVRVSQSGRELYGIEGKSVEAAIRELIQSGDSWLTAAAVATAAELKLKQLAPDIRPLSQKAGTEISLVANSAMTALA